jgi:hypothetical protein
VENELGTALHLPGRGLLKEYSLGVSPLRGEGSHVSVLSNMYSINLVKIYYSMFTPGLAIFYLATILRPKHVCGARAGFSNILSAGGSTLVPGHWNTIRLHIIVNTPKRSQEYHDSH